jgi:phosphohistidine phosphatase
MKTLLILRHAKSSWKHTELPDHERPLNKRGKSDAPRIGKLLRQQDLVPGLILSSTARRARQTVDLLVEASGYDGDVEYRDDLYFTDTEAYIHAVRDLPDEIVRVLVVGHNPDLEVLLDTLTGESASLPTAALARIDFPIQSW